MAAQRGDTGPRAPAARTLLLTLAFLAFVSLGLPDAVLGLLWPSVRAAFDLPTAALGAPLAVGAITYFISGIFAGKLTKTLGIGVLLATSTGLVTLGVLGYAISPSFVVFLGAACVVGFGSGAVDAGLNTYAAENFRAGHMSWLHASYSCGAALGPALVTTLLVRGASFRLGYALIASILSALTLAFVLTRRHWRLPGGSLPEAALPEPAKHGGTWHALRSTRVRISLLAFFFYTGVEVGAGQWSYTILTQSRGSSPGQAGVYVTAYWTTLFVGRVVSGFVVDRVGPVRLVRWALCAAFVGAATFATSSLPPLASAVGLGVTGLALAPVFPGLMSETPRRVGSALAPHAIGFQVSAATLGVAVLPNVGGLLAGSRGLDAVAAFIALCALILLATHELLVRVADRS